MNVKKLGPWLKVILVFAILFMINFISSFYSGFIDLTEDKRFTLTEPTLRTIDKVDEVVYVQILLAGEFPSGFKRLQNATLEMLNEFKDRNGKIVYEITDPNEGSAKEINDRRKQLADEGIIPTQLTFFDGTQTVTKVIYPHVIFNYGNRRFVVNLLEEQKPGDDEDIILNNSVGLLEYKFANAFQKMLLKDRQNIVFTAGNGELPSKNTYRLEKELRKYYNSGRIILDSVVTLDSQIDLLIVAAPREKVSLKNQFKIDQYLMNGGKIIWMIEKLEADLDSIAKYQYYIPRDIETDLDDMLFKYGVRVQPNLLLDLESTRIPQIVGMSGDQPQTVLKQWPYHPAVASKSSHPIVKNIARTNMFFPSTIDTSIVTATPIDKTVLLSSSQYSRVQFNPVRLNFEILKTPFVPAKFDKGPQPLAVLLEGEFESFFKNRVSEDFKNTLQQIGAEYKEKSPETKQIVISDVDFAKNLINTRTNETEEMGFNKWEVQYFKGNKDFILNSIEYMLDQEGILESRSKEVKLRLLDAVKTKEEKSKWQMINIGLPLAILAFFGILFNFLRRRKYSK